MPKSGIHPEWYPNAKVYYDGQLIMKVGSTKKVLNAISRLLLWIKLILKMTVYEIWSNSFGVDHHSFHFLEMQQSASDKIIIYIISKRSERTFIYFIAAYLYQKWLVFRQIKEDIFMRISLLQSGWRSLLIILWTSRKNSFLMKMNHQYWI